MTAFSHGVVTHNLSHGELFAGVGSFGMGFERAGIDTLWRAEIDPACQGVLRRHHPRGTLYGDVRTLRGAQLEPADIISAGFPCQDLSVAGRRHGLSGRRSGLFFEIPRIVREMREATLGRCPTFLVLENVPGLLSSHGGRDFAVVLRDLAELRPLDICWRVLDAQHFGVAQRRRRLFVVVDFAGERAGQVLFEPQSSARHPAPGREEGQGVAACLTGGAGGGRAHGKPSVGDRRTVVPVTAAPLTAGSAAGRGVNRPGRRREDDSNLVAGSLTARYHTGMDTTGTDPIVIQDASGAQMDCNGAGISEGGPAYTLNGRERQAVWQCHGTNVGEMGTLRAGNGHTTGGVPFVAQGLSNRGHGTGRAASPLRAQSHQAIPIVAHALTAEGHDAPEDGTGRGTPLVPTACPVRDVSTPLTANYGKQPDNSDTSQGPNLIVAHGVSLRGREGGATAELREEQMPAMRASQGGGDKPHVLSFTERGRADGRALESQEDLSYALNAPDGGGRTQERQIAGGFGVRRLTPTECERLQSWPDGWTECDDQGNRLADSVRYRLIGNGVVANVTEWIGRRIVAACRAAAV